MKCAKSAIQTFIMPKTHILFSCNKNVKQIKKQVNKDF